MSCCNLSDLSKSKCYAHKGIFHLLPACFSGNQRKKLKGNDNNQFKPGHSCRFPYFFHIFDYSFSITFLPFFFVLYCKLGKIIEDSFNFSFILFTNQNKSYF